MQVQLLQIQVEVDMLLVMVMMQGCRYNCLQMQGGSGHAVVGTDGRWGGWSWWSGQSL